MLAIDVPCATNMAHSKFVPGVSKVSACERLVTRKYSRQYLLDKIKYHKIFHIDRVTVAIKLFGKSMLSLTVHTVEDSEQCFRFIKILLLSQGK